MKTSHAWMGAPLGGAADADSAPGTAAPALVGIGYRCVGCGHDNLDPAAPLCPACGAALVCAYGPRASSARSLPLPRWGGNSLDLFLPGVHARDPEVDAGTDRERIGVAARSEVDRAPTWPDMSPVVASSDRAGDDDDTVTNTYLAFGDGIVKARAGSRDIAVRVALALVAASGIAALVAL